MSDAPSSLCDSVCTDTQSSAAGQHDVTDAAAQALYGQLFGALGGEADQAEQTGEACAGLVLANKKGAFSLWHLARGGAIGVTHAAVGRQLDPADLLSAGVKRMMVDADGQGADFGAVAQGVLEGALVAAGELGHSSSHCCLIKLRLVYIGNRQLEGDRLSYLVGGHRGQFLVPGVKWVERA